MDQQPVPAPVPQATPNPEPKQTVPTPASTPVQPTDAKPVADEPVLAEMSESLFRNLGEQARVQAAKERAEYICSKFGIPPEKLELWKQRHQYIESVHIQGDLYIYRALKRSELYMLQEEQQKTGNTNPEVGQESLVMKAVLFPKLEEGQLKVMPAGITSTLSEAITLLSGYGADDLPVRL